jgi:xylitol oxidase
VDELQTLVATHDRVKALGTRHSFTDIADTDGVLVCLDGLPPSFRVDERRQSASVNGAATFHILSQHLQRQGWALGTMASLPHISVAGAIATGTHGSGTQVQGLASMVTA